ncbi:MAG TPA: hypothetical protein VKS21_04375 [Spirochaetota bacterium]|nr:hypothetical protein [Spirochaetota bacterium]
MLSNLFTNGITCPQEGSLIEQIKHFFINTDIQLPIYQLLLLVLLLIMLGVILAKILQKLKVKRFINTNAFINTKIHYLTEHSITIYEVDRRNPAVKKRKILASTADRYKVGEIKRSLGNINGITLRCTATDLNRQTVVDKIITIELKSLFPRSNDYLKIDLTGKESASTSSYRSMIPETDQQQPGET